MTKYPPCDKQGCWYSGNKDRISDYEGSTTIVFSTNTSDEISGESPPCKLLLCDVCRYDYSTIGKCKLCRERMFDEWIIFGNEHYCRYCRCCIHDDDIKNHLADLCGSSDYNVLDDCSINELKMEEHVINIQDEILVVFNTPSGPLRIQDLLRDIIHKKHQEKEEESEKKEEEETQCKRKRVQSLKDLFQLESDELTAQIVDKLDKELPEFNENKRAKTLLWLLEK